MVRTHTHTQKYTLNADNSIVYIFIGPVVCCSYLVISPSCLSCRANPLHLPSLPPSGRTLRIPCWYSFPFWAPHLLPPAHALRFPAISPIQCVPDLPTVSATGSNGGSIAVGMRTRTSEGRHKLSGTHAYIPKCIKERNEDHKTQKRKKKRTCSSLLRFSKAFSSDFDATSACVALESRPFRLFASFLE